MSDSHIGFDKEANPDALGTLREAVAKVKAMPTKPSFIIHTGDITHLSKPAEFDNADKVFGETGVQMHWVPGEHDLIDEDRGKAYLDRYGKGSKGAGWYSFDDHGVHFIGLVNVVDLKGGGLGNLGAEQLAWLEADLKGKSNSTPIVVFAHIPLQVLYKEWGWGTEDGNAGARPAQALRFGHHPQRPHPSAGAEGRRQHDLPHRAVDGVPAAGAGHARLRRVRCWFPPTSFAASSDCRPSRGAGQQAARLRRQDAGRLIRGLTCKL